MSTCLGIYINKNIIKYAKVTKDKMSTKVDAFGVKIYFNLKETIEQIISETYSFKIPISINMSEEMYNYFYMSDLLSKKDMSRAIKTEFESYCYDKNYNPNALEARYILVNDANDKEKIKVIHLSIDKIKLNKIMLDFEGQKLSTITPIALDIPNIVPINVKENVAIVNIEDTTTITIVMGEKVYEVKKIDVGASKILDAINAKENSYAKAYEICKNTTIYTMQGKSLQQKESEYLSDIIPILYQIASELNEVINSSLIKINKVYITGLASVINNIDLYFEEVLNNTKCEILKPFFIEDNPKINIKDYIEVNSAIALALQGLNYGLKDINFTKEKSNSFFNNLFTPSETTNTSGFIQKLNSINISDTALSKGLIGALIVVGFTFLSYTGISMFLNNRIESKANQVASVEDNTNKQISAIKSDMTSVNSKTSEYNSLTKNLKEASDTISDKNSYKNTIPVLLSQLMSVIPKEVQLTSIDNPSERKVVIKAQSSKYEQLAYFKAKLKSEGILEPSSVVSSEAEKENDVVKIQIEGELP